MVIENLREQATKLLAGGRGGGAAGRAGGGQAGGGGDRHNNSDDGSHNDDAETGSTTRYGSLEYYDSHLAHLNDTPLTGGDGHYDHGSVTSSCNSGDDDASGRAVSVFGWFTVRVPSLRRIALRVSLWFNVLITLAKLVAYLQTFSLSVLAALLDAVLDVVSQMVLNYTEKHSSLQRSSALYPAGASRLEPIGVLTCAALMGMASFEVLKESATSLIYGQSTITEEPSMASFWNMFSIVLVKMFLLWLCNAGANKRVVLEREEEEDSMIAVASEKGLLKATGTTADHHHHHHQHASPAPAAIKSSVHTKAVVQMADPTIEALAQDHFNDILSNGVAAVALLFALRSPALWFLDPLGAILISVYIIYSWYMTGKEQIEHLTGKVAPEDFIEELKELAANFDDRLEVDVVRAYHFGPKFLVEIEIVMPKETLLFESHDVGMDLQYEIEGREEVERCFVHIDYETRPYDEHVVSKVPELREKYRPKKLNSARSL